MALKAALFEAVLDDPDRARGADDLPLVAYVADEFHRYVTADPVHGEQSYLDTCRSYGGVCVLATQSLASLKYAFAQRGACPTITDAALSVIWTNTATKVAFRSTDRETLSRVSELCLQTPGLARVVEVRPLSSLAVGQCYAAVADGRLERCRLAPYVGVEAAREVRVARLLPAPEAAVGARACDDGEVDR